MSMITSLISVRLLAPSAGERRRLNAGRVLRKAPGVIPLDIICKRAEHLGTVEAANEQEAIEKAAKYFIPPERHNRIPVEEMGKSRDYRRALNPSSACAVPRAPSLPPFALGLGGALGGARVPWLIGYG